MKKFKIRIDVPCFEEATTESHRIKVEGESHKDVLHKFTRDHYESFEVGPKVVDCIAFYDGDFYTVIPFNKISQIDVKECK